MYTIPYTVIRNFHVHVHSISIAQVPHVPSTAAPAAEPLTTTARQPKSTSECKRKNYPGGEMGGTILVNNGY